ncbi:hypothetical protein BVRB_4g089880 isoform A [Beta vulgaris subsp. vulgaris]|uniref:probable ubiquitin-like-specific protease 2A isoform X2 n=1 Tax=Beta vulgaris subsp. vulgaris TaxID=3555 RepID=UPI0005401ABF|nr:probable ubiquitin-like-specific protease 2A isoform X2 [Beta vulgaris subsp. vulgaris]KMT12899.1 hypothetical protein BVRB_4g089880 isoform A [Beta vulgaris subsp. vulgaris]
MRKRKNRISTKSKDDTDDHETPFSGFIPCRTRSKRRSIHLSGKRSKMDDGTFNNHLENIWRSFSEDKRAAFAHLDCLFFMIYKNENTHALEQMKRKEIFSKKGHWRLVIFCHFGEAVRSRTRNRCILLLDSVEMCAKLIGPDLRKFVFDIFKAEGRPESKDVIYRIPLLVPKVPQQTNDFDCGRFVLYFIKLFMNAAPENFCISKGKPDFFASDWFDPECFAKFCDELEENIPSTHERGVERRFSQRIRNTRALAQNKSGQNSQNSFSQVKEVILVDDSETSS